MNSTFRFVAITIFLAGLVTIAILGTSTSMTFIWPGYLVIGAAGMASVVAIFRRTKFAIPWWCVGAFFLAAAYFILRATQSPVSYFAREDGALLTTCFIAYAFFLSMFDDIRLRQRLFWCIAGIVSLNLIFGGIQFIWKPEIWLLPAYQRTYSGIGGLFNHPDHFAAFLAALIPFFLSSIIFSRRRRAIRSVLIVLCSISFLAILLSGSLLGLLGLLAGISLLGVLTLILSWKNLVAATQRSVVWGLAGTAIVAAGFFSINLSRIESLVDDRLMTRSGSDIGEVWASSLEQFKESPAFGTGSRTFYFYSRKFSPEKEGAAEFESAFVHNEYLQVLADYGIFGLLIVMALAGVHLFNGVRFVLGYTGFEPSSGKVLPRSNHLGLVAGSLGSLGAIATLAVFDFVIHIPVIALLTTLFLGVLACPDPMSRALQSEEEEPSIPGGGLLFVGRGLAFGCGIALTLFSIIFSRSEWNMEMARNTFRAGDFDPVHFRHLEAARSIDPANPFAWSLTAHSHVMAIDPHTDGIERIRRLEKASLYYDQAAKRFPTDIHIAMAHSVVLDSLERPGEAAGKLAMARTWAPHLGKVMVAEGEHFLRTGQFELAEQSFRRARDARVYPEEKGAVLGLLEVARWKEETGTIPATDEVAATQSFKRTLNEARIDEKSVGGDFGHLIDIGIRNLEQKLNAELIEGAAIEVE